MKGKISYHPSGVLKPSHHITLHLTENARPLPHARTSSQYSTQTGQTYALHHPKSITGKHLVVNAHANSIWYTHTQTVKAPHKHTPHYTITETWAHAHIFIHIIALLGRVCVCVCVCILFRLMMHWVMRFPWLPSVEGTGVTELLGFTIQQMQLARSCMCTL